MERKALRVSSPTMILYLLDCRVFGTVILLSGTRKLFQDRKAWRGAAHGPAVGHD